MDVVEVEVQVVVMVSVARGVMYMAVANQLTMHRSIGIKTIKRKKHYNTHNENWKHIE